MNHYHYDTVTEAINGLKQRGYTLDFGMDGNRDCLECAATNIRIPASALQIEEVHRFEGQTDPGDEMIVLALVAPQLQLRGVLVNAYGLYADDAEGEIVKHIRTHLH